MLPHLPRRFCAIIFATCIILTIILLLISGNYLPKSFWADRSYRTINDGNSSFQISDGEANDLVTILRLFRAFSILRDNPLFILDSDLLNCTTNDLNRCMRILFLSNHRYVIFGYFPSKLAMDVGSIIEEALSSDIYFEIKNYATGYYLRKKRVQSSVIVLIPIEERQNYWFIHGIPDLNLHAFALLKPSKTRNIDIENGLAKLSFADEPTDKFSRRLRESRFLECNRTIAESVRTKFAEQYNAAPVISDNFLNGLAYFRDLLLTLNVTAFLSGGTLLGWYRDCGIIPHTTDMDFAAFASDYNEKIEPALNKDKIVKLYWRLGKADDSLEFSVYYGSTKLDLFFLYNTPGSNDSWVGGMIVGSRTKLKWTYPRLDELCTGDLKGHLFHVPCNVETILESDYGPEWHVPHHSKDFVWHKSHRNVHQAGHWKKEEWSQVYRLYDNH